MMEAVQKTSRLKRFQYQSSTTVDDDDMMGDQEVINARNERRYMQANATQKIQCHVFFAMTK